MSYFQQHTEETESLKILECRLVHKSFTLYNTRQLAESDMKNNWVAKSKKFPEIRIMTSPKYRLSGTSKEAEGEVDCKIGRKVAAEVCGRRKHLNRIKNFSYE